MPRYRSENADAVQMRSETFLTVPLAHSASAAAKYLHKVEILLLRAKLNTFSKKEIAACGGEEVICVISVLQRTMFTVVGFISHSDYRSKQVIFSERLKEKNKVYI